MALAAGRKASDFSFSRTDHQVHLTASYGLNLTGMLLLEKKAGLSRWESALISSLSVLALGAAKEAFKDDQFDNSDMVANTIGTMTAAGVFLLFEF